MVKLAHETSVFPNRVREFEVLRIHNVTPGMRRVVLGGPAVAEHIRDGITIPALRTFGFDDDIKIVLPDLSTHPQEVEPPRNTIAGTLQWSPGSTDFVRTYTVRAFDAEARELTIDFALHATGLASTWARRTKPGDTLPVIGPRLSAGLPTSADWMLIGGDETALPAIGHCLEKLPPDLPATVVIEVAEPSHHQDLFCAAPVDITWLYRSESNGETRLAETVRQQPWRDGQPFLWVAGETITIKPLRRWASQEMSIPREHTQIAGYWRRREVVPVADDPELVDVAADVSHTFERISARTDLLTPYAVRSAVTLGVFAAIDAGADTPDSIATACRANPGAMARLLRHLASIGFLRRAGQAFSLTEDSVFLADPEEWWSQQLHFDSAPSHLELSLVGLLDAVRTGTPTHRGATSLNAWLVEGPQNADRFHDTLTASTAYLAPAIVESINFDGVTTVTVVGEGGGAYADVIARELPGLQISMMGPPSMTTRMVSDVAAGRRAEITIVTRGHTAPLPQRCDLLLVSDVVDTLPDSDVTMALAAYGDSADRIVIATTLLDEVSPTEADTRDDLRRLCALGSGRRTEAELRAMIKEAGGDILRIGPLGWGSHVIEYRQRP
jgi:NADPH-dependent ferric siderophore reductase